MRTECGFSSTRSLCHAVSVITQCLFGPVPAWGSVEEQGRSAAAWTSLDSRERQHQLLFVLCDQDACWERFARRVILAQGLRVRSVAAGRHSGRSMTSHDLHSQERGGERLVLSLLSAVCAVGPGPQPMDQCQPHLGWTFA